MQNLILLLQILNGLQDLFDFHLILEPAFHFFDLVHEVHLGLVFELEDAIDEFLFDLVSHYQKKDQFHHLRNKFTLQQLLLVASLELQVLDLAEVFLDLEQVHLELKLAISDIGKEVRVNFAKQARDDPGSL